MIVRFPLVVWLTVFTFLTNVTSLRAQGVSLEIKTPSSFKGRGAILLTREKGFASTVHSIKLTRPTVTLDLATDLVPDLYQLNIAGIKGALLFFLEPGTHILVDSSRMENSVVTFSKSDRDWRLYNEAVQQPSEKRIANIAAAEERARKQRRNDSLSYWLEQRVVVNQQMLDQTGAFIETHPASFVSLYLLKVNWYAFRNKGYLEHLDPSLHNHKNYRLLATKPDLPVDKGRR